MLTPQPAGKCRLGLSRKLLSTTPRQPPHEHRGLRFDLGEGLLEIVLVLSSLYFISHKMMFPVLGVTAGIAGIAIAVSGLLL